MSILSNDMDLAVKFLLEDRTNPEGSENLKRTIGRLAADSELKMAKCFVSKGRRMMKERR